MFKQIIRTALIYIVIVFMLFIIPGFLRTHIFPTINDILFGGAHFCLYLLYPLLYLTLGDYIGRKFKEKSNIHVIILVSLTVIITIFKGFFDFFSHPFMLVFLIVTPFIMVPSAFYHEKLKFPPAANYVTAGLWFIPSVEVFLMLYCLFLRCNKVPPVPIITMVIVVLIAIWRLYDLSVKKKEAVLMEIMLAVILILIFAIPLLTNLAR